jgi:hypothetical protein
MKALARVLTAAVVLAALSVLPAGAVYASPPQVDHGSVERPPVAQQRHGKVWRCNSGHGPQFDCDDQGSLAGSQPSPSPAARRSLVLVRTIAGFSLLLAMATGGNWLRRRHRPREAT